MCKCCQSCLETCYWHLIEKRFFFDEDIALYEDPEKPEKNNNMFENLAFYDSVSVIAGRAVVTIEPISDKKPIIVQPRLQHHLDGWNDDSFIFTRSEPTIVQIENAKNKYPKFTISPCSTEESLEPVFDTSKSLDDLKTFNEHRETQYNMGGSSPQLKLGLSNNLHVPDTNRRKSLLERRMSKSLHLIIENDREKDELPIIRQQSMPKFFIGAPEEHQIENTAFKTPSSALSCPVPAYNKKGFVYDLSSVVQLEKEREMERIERNSASSTTLNSPNISADKYGRKQFRDKIVKLRRIKSTMSAFQTLHM